MGRLRWLVAVVLLVVGASGCGGDDESSPGSGEKVDLTVWSWDPAAETGVRLYEKEHPNVKVKLVNAGSTTDEYTKFRAAIKAGQDDPDVIMLGFTDLPQFIVDGSVRDLSDYGADEVLDDFAPWYVDLVSYGDGGPYGMPLDAGVMAFLYRGDTFARLRLKPPKTWAEFATIGQKLREADSHAYISEFPISWDWLSTLMWQRGSRPFKLDGETISIHLDDPAALDVAAYWDDLLAKDLVRPTAETYSNQWFKGIDNGTFVGIIAAQWTPVLIEETSATYGKWRAAPLPQWSPDENVQPVWGGSVHSVSAKSDHPEEAADLVKFMHSEPEVVKAVDEAVPYAFYPLKSLYESEEWRDRELPFYGPQKANEVFGDAAAHVEGDYEASPFQDFVGAQGDKLFGEAIENGSSLVDALRKLQPIVVEYAERQGFTVVE